jgi:hypothetical protein
MLYWTHRVKEGVGPVPAPFVFLDQFGKGARSDGSCAFFVSTKDILHDGRKDKKRRRKTNLSTNTKVRGGRAEIAFWLATSSLGFRVSKPYGDSAPYDFLVDNGNSVLRVQVKSTANMHCRAYNLLAKHGRFVNYKSNEVDIIAAYVVPRNVWYLIPLEAIPAMPHVIRLYPDGVRSGGGKFEKYRDAWCQLACRRERCFENLPIHAHCQEGGTCPFKE